MFLVLRDENFEKEISQAKKPVLVDFWMENCFPCVLLSPILEKIAKEFSETRAVAKDKEEDKSFAPKLIFAKVNFDTAPLTIQKYGLRAAPTVILFKEGKPISGFVGLRQEAEIREWLNNLLKNND